MGSKYTRVRDKITGHEYDVLTHRVDDDKHELADQERWPPIGQPRAPRHNVKGPRPRTTRPRTNDSGSAVGGDTVSPGAAQESPKPPKQRRTRSPKAAPAS